MEAVAQSPGVCRCPLCHQAAAASQENVTSLSWVHSDFRGLREGKEMFDSLKLQGSEL